MLSANSNYGLMFADVLHRSIRNLTHGSWKRDRNPGAPFHFGENHLRKALRSHIHPVEWPPLVIERSVAGDLVEKDKQHGGVDLFFAPYGSRSVVISRMFSLRARLRDQRGGVSWRIKKELHPKIVADLRKAALASRNGPRRRTLSRFDGATSPWLRHPCRVSSSNHFNSRRSTNTYLEETSWVEMPDVEQLNVIVLQVLPKTRTIRPVAVRAGNTADAWRAERGAFVAPQGGLVALPGTLGATRCRAHCPLWRAEKREFK